MGMAKSYLQYWKVAKSRHGVHSPFVYALIEDVIQPKDWPGKKPIRMLRKEMLQDKRSIEIQDLGAGSRVLKQAKRKVRDIAKVSSANNRQCGFLYRLAHKLESRAILELGTNLGLSTASLAMVPGSHVVSIEGDPELAKIAAANLEKLNINAQIVQGSFESKLPEVLGKFDKIDFAYIDGNHSAEPTLTYFDLISQQCDASSVIVVGDIHWSAGMEFAWAEIKKKPEVRVTLDLFDMGLVFFNPELSREDFILKNK